MDVTASSTRPAIHGPARLRTRLCGHEDLVVVGTCFLLYAFACILRTSFVVDGVRYFTLADDQMISMRYADNFANGYGLVWNRGGPRVEGYTNFAWMLFMALFHRLGIPRHAISVCIQASGAVCLLANLALVKKVAHHVARGMPGVALLALILTAFYIPLDNWAFQGTEVGPLTLTVTLGIWLTLQVVDSGKSALPLYVLLASGTLVRPDMAVFAVATLGVLVYLRPEQSVRHALVGGGLLLLFLAGATGFRLWYFGDPLPNTFYLKLTGFPLIPRLTRGALVTIVLRPSSRRSCSCSRADATSRGTSRSSRCRQSSSRRCLCRPISFGGDAWEWWGGATGTSGNRRADYLFFIGVAAAASATPDTKVSRQRNTTQSNTSHVAGGLGGQRGRREPAGVDPVRAAHQNAAHHQAAANRG